MPLTISRRVAAVAVPKPQPSPAQKKAELGRLQLVKRDYRTAIEGRPPAHRTTERAVQLQRVKSARAALQVATRLWEQAQTPANRAVFLGAERNLRTEYARNAVVGQLAPVRLDRAVLHDFADALKAMKLPRLQQEAARIAGRLNANDYGGGYDARVAQGMDRARAAIVGQAISKLGGVAKVDRTRNAGNVVFNGPGMFINAAGAFTPGAWAQKLRGAGITWVSLQVNNNGPNAGNVAALEQGWAQQWKAAGFKVGFWGVSYENPEADAKDAARLTKQYGGDFYIADCEGHFQFGQGDVGRNKRFVDAFTAEAAAQGIPNVPRALSSMGRVALDMKPWIDGGWDAMPQAYWNSYEHYSPSLSVKFYEENGWPKGRIHPTIATYDGSSEGNARPKSIAEYAADLRKGGTTEFSYYLPESYLDDAKYAELKAALAAGMNG